MPGHIAASVELAEMLAGVLDDIGPIDSADAHRQAREVWDLLLKRHLKREVGNNERFRLITRYLGNGGNPLILARWLRATGALGNEGNVKETAKLMQQICSDTLFPGGNPRERFKVYQWDRKELVPVPAFAHSDADRALYDEAIATLHGRYDHRIKKRKVLDDSRWKEREGNVDDILGTGWTAADI